MFTRRMFAALSCAAVALGMGGFVGTAAAAAPPANDTIGGAIAVSLPFSATVDTTGATSDADDAQVNSTCGAPVTNNSVWYTFTAGPSDTLLVVDTTGSDFSSGVIIATGTPGALNTQACSPVSTHVAVTAGTTYYILAFDDTASGGTLQIAMHGAGPPPANDTAAAATTVGGLPFNDTVDTTGATTDADDAQLNASCGAPAFDNSVWYKFTAGPNDGNIFVDAFASDYNAGVAIATGTPGALTTMACGPFQVVASTTPGTTYYIAVFDFAGGGGGTLQLTMDVAPTIKLDVFRNTRVDGAGNAYVRGTYSCTGAQFLDISGTLVEIVGRNVAYGTFDKSIERLNCDGARHNWRSTVHPTLGAFAPGKAAAFTSGFGCGDVVCVEADKVQVLTLATVAGGTPSSASVKRLRTRATLRSASPSRRAYGARGHTAAANWGH